MYADKGIAPPSDDHEPNMLTVTLTRIIFIRLGGIRTRDGSIERAMSYHLTTNPQ